MNDAEYRFIYQDAQGNVTAREIFNFSKSEEHIQGICKSANELRTFRKDRILEIISDQNILEEKLQYHKENAPPPVTKISKSARSKNGGDEICFTGFKSEDKERLIQMANGAGMDVVKSVTQNLVFLCCGNRAGPKKRDKARHQGVIALSEEQLINLLSTGEVPENW